MNFTVNQVQLDVKAHARDQPNIEEGDNNGLENAVRELEKLYTNKDHLSHMAPSLDVSLRDSGKSRADLWAFAAIMATEYGIDTTNIACTEGDHSPKCVRLKKII